MQLTVTPTATCDCWFTFITERACDRILYGKCLVCKHSYREHTISHYYYHKAETEIPILRFDWEGLLANTRENKNLLEIKKSFLSAFEKSIDETTDKLEIKMRKFQSIGSNSFFSIQAIEHLNRIQRDINNIPGFKHQEKINSILQSTLEVIQNPITAKDSDVKYRWACGFLEINPDNPDEEQISRNFRKKARAAHPDAVDGQSSTIFLYYNHAKEFLKKRVPKWLKVDKT